jgi:hypothetical protein
MIQDNKVQVSDIAFEPSDLVEYGEARERTRNAGQPTNTPRDGNQYNS